MTVNTLRNTIQSALPGNVFRTYGSYVGPVVEALEARERDGLAQIAASLRSAAESAGYDMDDVNSVLASAGLPDAPAPVVEEASFPEAAPLVDTSGLEAQIAGLRADVSRLTQAAQRAGVRV